MILYEVRIAVDAELTVEFHDWLMAHIHEILALPGFEFAELLREEGNAQRAVFVEQVCRQAGYEPPRITTLYELSLGD